MRFSIFLITVIMLSLALLYVLGDRRQPEARLITQDIELNGREQP